MWARGGRFVNLHIRMYVSTYVRPTFCGENHPRKGPEIEEVDPEVIIRVDAHEKEVAEMMIVESGESPLNNTHTHADADSTVRCILDRYIVGVPTDRHVGVPTKRAFLSSADSPRRWLGVRRRSAIFHPVNLLQLQYKHIHTKITFSSQRVFVGVAVNLTRINDNKHSKTHTRTHEIHKMPSIPWGA